MNSSDSSTRRSFLTALGTLAAAPLFARDFGAGAPPMRYPEPDVLVLDPRFKAKVGSSLHLVRSSFDVAILVVSSCEIRFQRAKSRGE